jgi:hypothetical protein
MRIINSSTKGNAAFADASFVAGGYTKKRKAKQSDGLFLKMTLKNSGNQPPVDDIKRMTFSGLSLNA